MAQMILEFSEEAQSDILDIFEFSVETWGKRQAGLYQKNLEDVLSTIAANPRIGRERLNFRYFYAASHVIFYAIGTKRISIIRILHNQDPFTQLLRDES